MPAEKAAVTPSGKPTVHKRSQTERNTLYAQHVASTLLATVRETFAVAPSIQHASLLAVVKTHAVGGTTSLAALAAAGFDAKPPAATAGRRSTRWRLFKPQVPACSTRRGGRGHWHRWISTLSLTSLVS